jgi:DNA-binding transcriptional MerR regulator
MASSVPLGLTTPQVCKITGVAKTTLDYWVRTGLVQPSILGSAGHRFTRWWSIQDTVTVRTIKTLREAGCPLQTVRRAKTVVEDWWNEPLSEVVLFWDGSDVLAIEPWGTVRSAVRHPGQQALHLVALPVTRWARELEAHAVEVTDLQEQRARRRGNRGRTGTVSIRAGGRA